MILYHFLEAKWALEAIKNQRLKVSNFKSLNDPFELLHLSLKDKDMRTVMQQNKNRLSETFRLLCFSERWDSPVQWGHYANNHKGLVLQFNIDDSLVEEVRYKKNRPQLKIDKLFAESNENTAKLIKRIMTTKYIDWSYEEEWRMILMKKEIYSDNNLEFIDFNELFQLTAVIKGSLNDTSNSEIKNYLPIQKSLKIIQARNAFNSYRIVRDRNKPIHNLAKA